MEDNILKRISKPIKLGYFILIKFLFFIQIIELCTPLCPQKNSPFLKEGVCLDYCSKEEIDEKLCVVENEVIKNQWINNINYLSEGNYKYINLVSTEKGDLIIVISTYPATNTRLFYGLTKEGRGYFTVDDKESKIFSMTMSSTSIIMRFESETFMVKLQAKTSKQEYIMEFGKSPQLLHLYDLDSKRILIQEFSDVFYQLNNIHQMVGTSVKLSDNNYNYYLIGLLAIKYVSGIGTNTLYLIKFRVASLNSAISINDKRKAEVQAYNSSCISCYETSTNYIICFYKNKNNKYTIGPFNSNLSTKPSVEIANGNNNHLIFFKCVHFYKDIGAFLYYTNENPPHAVLEFKKYSNDEITDSYTKISFNDYSFYYNITLNDIIKVFDKKIYFAAASLDKLKIYNFNI